MFQAARKHLRAVAMLGVAAALVVGGVAAAQGDSQSGSQANGQDAGKRPPGPPPAMGIAMKGLTYAELHVLGKSGGAETIRIDQGEVKSVSDSSIALTENDDSEVTIAVDADTEVLGRPGEETSLGDLEAGQQVSVSAPEGEAASSIMVLPKRGEMVAGFQGGPMPPPAGAPIERGAQRTSGN